MRKDKGSDMSPPQSSPSQDGEMVDLYIPSLPERATDVDRLIDQMTLQVGYAEDIRGDIMIAVNEVVKNAILHGNKCDASKSVHILCRCNPEEFCISISDKGMGFDLNAVPDPLDPDNLLKESGRGLFILRALMDRVDFDMRSDGTTVTMVKYGRQT